MHKSSVEDGSSALVVLAVDAVAVSLAGAVYEGVLEADLLTLGDGAGAVASILLALITLLVVPSSDPFHLDILLCRPSVPYNCTCPAFYRNLTRSKRCHCICQFLAEPCNLEVSCHFVPFRAISPRI